MVNEVFKVSVLQQCFQCFSDFRILTKDKETSSLNVENITDFAFRLAFLGLSLTVVGYTLAV
jgi:hypothetical protein